MAISYKKLWKLLIDKDMTAVELREKTGIAPNTMTKLRRDEEVSMTVLIKICNVLNANIGDVMDLIPEQEVKPLTVWGGIWAALARSWGFMPARAIARYSFSLFRFIGSPPEYVRTERFEDIISPNGASANIFRKNIFPNGDICDILFPR